MCKSKKVTMASDPKLKPKPSPRASRSSDTMSSSFAAMTESSITTGALTSTSFSCDSLASVRDSLREVPRLYPFPEICSATNNFLSRRLSSSSSAWRCTLRGADAVVLQRTLRGDAGAVPAHLSALCRSHHTSVARLLGASLPGDGRIYIAYEHVAGATLADCLRNPRNPGFTPLSSWISRMQVAADLAQGLDYIHHHSSFSSSPTPAPCRRGTVHNRIKSSGVIVTEPGFRAKICHLGAAELAGELPASPDGEKGEEIYIPRGISDEFSASPAKTRRSDSSGARIEGTRGYIAPEVLAGRRISQSSDVFGFGVVLLELLSGDEPLRYRLEKGRIERVSLIETAMEAYGPAGEDEEGKAATLVAEERRGRIRRWVDRRLRDSFPIEVAEKLIRLALRCVEAEAAMRPDMVWVAGKVSRLFLESMLWEERVGLTLDMSLSLAPR